MAKNPTDNCVSCQIKKCFRCVQSFYLDEHIPKHFQQPIRECIPYLKEHDIKLRDFIRSGRFGCVCSALMRGNKVAVKVVLDKCHSNFDKEFHLIKELEHPHVMDVLHEIKIGSTKFMVMPLAHYDLKNYLWLVCKKKLLSEQEIRCFFIPIVSGVEHIHQKGYAHKDIKLLNILLTEDLTPKISDFDSIEYCYESDGNLKYKTITIGTNSYLSPEVILSQPISDLRKVDVWALGIVLFEMLFLRTPFIPKLTKLKDFKQFLPFISNNQMTQNIPKNSNITSFTMNLLNRLLINDYSIREPLNVISDTDPWFNDKTLKLPEVRHPIPPKNKYSIFFPNEKKTKTTKISSFLNYLKN